MEDTGGGTERPDAQRLYVIIKWSSATCIVEAPQGVALETTKVVTKVTTVGQTTEHKLQV